MSKIQWTDVSDNPIYIRKEDGSNGGHWCSKKSEGCASCYAEEINQSGFFSFASHLPYTGKPPEGLYFDESIVRSWARMRSSKKHFVCSMTDLFGEWVPMEWQHKVFDAALAAPKQTIQLVTKRPNIARDSAIEWCKKNDRKHLPENIWMGCTVENQRCADERIPYLETTPAKIRFLSVEPLLEEIDLSMHLDRISWAIVGGESGSKARPCDIRWIQSIVQQCKDSDVACFVKQLGNHALTGFESISEPPGCPVEKIWIHVPYKTSDRKGGDINEFPEDLQVREFPRLAEVSQ